MILEKNYIVDLQSVDIYRKDKVIFEALNLQLFQGEFCYLIGKTGSGKSSLLQTLYGANPLRKGKGIVAQQALHGLTHKNLPNFRKRIGMVFQDFKLFEEWTVHQNLSYVLKATNWKDERKMNERIEEVLTHVELIEKMDESLVELSGGEQQRIAIARAILNKPALLIADEPTGNLDPESADRILYLLRDLTKAEGMTTIFATHDYRLIEKFPSRVFRAVNGQLSEQ